MSLNVLGGLKVYTVQEIDTIIQHAGASFEIVDKLPTLAAAVSNCVYYKKSNKKITDIWWSNPDDPTDIADEQDTVHTEQHSEERQVLIPYIKGIKDGEDCWYTTGGSSTGGDHEPITEERVREIWQQEMGTPKRYTLIRTGKALAEVD